MLLLGRNELHRIETAWEETGLDYVEWRDLMLRNTGWTRHRLEVRRTPALQLNSDLDYLNRGALSDGSHPMLRWLENACRELSQVDASQLEVLQNQLEEAQ